jgi:ABC-type lipopolysaccharide export system ATPase subunit
MIEARGLVKRYGSTMAVSDLSFSIRPGMVTGFLGPNGAGKTTTMRMILGLDAPTRGSVTVGGRSYRDLPAPMREVGALLDAKALHGGRRARDHLLCLARSNGIPRRRVDEVLRIVGLEGVARRRAKGFSLGMGQRLGIASALLGDPAVLIFDEPVNGLDLDGICWVTLVTIVSLTHPDPTQNVALRLFAPFAFFTSYENVTEVTTWRGSPWLFIGWQFALCAIAVLAALLRGAESRVRFTIVRALPMAGVAAVLLLVLATGGGLAHSVRA